MFWLYCEAGMWTVEWLMVVGEEVGSSTQALRGLCHHISSSKICQQACCLQIALSQYCVLWRWGFWTLGVHSPKTTHISFERCPASRAWPFLLNYRDSELFERRGMFPTPTISNARADLSKPCTKRCMWKGLCLFYLCLLLLCYQSYKA